MSLSELLSLVQLTKEHLFEGKEPAKAPTPPPVKPQPPVVKPAPAPDLQKKTPVYKAPLEVKSGPKPQVREVNDVLDLLKVHCPLLKLIDPPQNKILILFDPETHEEKQILLNIANALKKEGYEVEMTKLDEFNPKEPPCRLLIAEKALVLKDPLFKEIAKRDAKGTLFFADTKAFVIPSLAELIAKPDLRRELWNQILKLIK